MRSTMCVAICRVGFNERRDTYSLSIAVGRGVRRENLPVEAEFGAGLGADVISPSEGNPAVPVRVLGHPPSMPLPQFEKYRSL